MCSSPILRKRYDKQTRGPISSRSAFIFQLLDKYKALVDQALPNPVERTANTSLPCSKSVIASFCSSFRTNPPSRLNIAFRKLETLEILSPDKPCCFRTCIFIDRCIVLWTNQVLPLLLQRDSLNTSRSKDRTVSLFFLPKPLHSPHPLGSYIALPSSRSLFKTNMVKVCARSRRSNGKIGDCEQSNFLLLPRPFSSKNSVGT